MTKPELNLLSLALLTFAVGTTFSSTAGAGAREAAAGSAPVAADHMSLRVCADPDNLPFSSSNSAQRGLYIELAELIGQRLGRHIDYVWWLSFNQRRTLRNTLLSGDCDVYVALPAKAGSMGKNIVQSKPFMSLSYAMVTRADVTIRNAGELAGKRIGVQFGSTPQIYFAAKGGFETTTEKSAIALLDDLAEGRVDAVFLWGPEGGYLNKTRFDSRFEVTPLSGTDMLGEVAIAVRVDHKDLLEHLNRALDDLKPEIVRLAEKYGFPVGRALNLTQDTSRHRVRSLNLQNSARTNPLLIRVSDGAEEPGSGPTTELRIGREVFNNHCSHCHAQDAKSPISERDLRRLKSRYTDKWQEVAVETIMNGRQDYGMPTWSGILTGDELNNILAFLGTIQN